MSTKTLLLLLLWLPMWGLAQTQQGYVKVIGRPDKPGQMLDHVVIQVKGMTNPVMSDSAGQFRFTIPGKGEGDPIVLLSVRKNGYELKDQGMVGRQFAYSSRVPLYITMVDTKQLAADKQRIEDNAYRVAEESYQKKLEIIEQLLAEAKISNENYRQEVQKLEDGYEKYVALIGDMADHYARTDYDQLDSIDYQISQCIENGELERADSLIHTVFDPETVLERNRAAKQEIADRIALAQSIIDKASADKESIMRDIDYAKRIATLCDDLAAEYINAGQTEQAIPCLEKALEIKRIVYGEESQDFLTTRPRPFLHLKDMRAAARPVNPPLCLQRPLHRRRHHPRNPRVTAWRLAESLESTEHMSPYFPSRQKSPIKSLTM